ncbi:hypothetical protein GQS_06865 [Thermococcus sp. 4557]|uniref:hypothetical protein n=1 Tax=Thermococcus sp. (strain CGMCC 1.5172 / 4557) TaxID=1042877 RepID=UPI000219E9B4|nr:hypothetical protein [Thermococcus sp. 4557]AEK73271.1 hypothetical protein GQS_06865 [Thermococcus sp. 4557]
MEEVRELKTVLERVEGKLIAAGKMYGAMNFAVWLVIMSLYYVIMGILDLPWQFNLVYWPAAFIVAMKFTGSVWKRYVRLAGIAGNSWKEGAAIMGVWIAGVLLGWVVVPLALNKPVDTEIGVALLTFISFSVGGMFALTREREMIPAFGIPAILIPFAYSTLSNATVLAAFGIALGFSLTTLWYLHSAFRAIER